MPQVGQAFDFLISSYSQLAEWRATTDRLTMFNNVWNYDLVPKEGATPSGGSGREHRRVGTGGGTRGADTLHSTDRAEQIRLAVVSR